MNKNATISNRKNAKRDPLQGAPGHNLTPPTAEHTTESKDVQPTKENEPQSPMVESLIQNLGAVFGAESVEKWRELLKTNTADAQAAFYGILRDQFPELPEDFSLADLVKIAATKPIQAAKDHPVTTAATVAAGVGALVMVREYLAGNLDLGKTGTRAKAIVAEAVAIPVKLAATTKKKKTSRKTVSKGRGKAKAKATAKKPKRKSTRA